MFLKIMDFSTIILMALALSMDAFAVAITNGICIKYLKVRDYFKIGFAFGLFQGLMPLIGWTIGRELNHLISECNHWIAFILLLFIGFKMIYEAVRGPEQGLEGECCVDESKNVLSFKLLIVLAIATSLDALAAGISLAMMQLNIYFAASIIALITFVLSFIGVLIGKRWGKILGNKAEIIGGIILILIGVKILLEGLGIIYF